MRKTGLLLIVLLALTAFAAAAEKPKEFGGGGERVAPLLVIFEDDAERSIMYWFFMTDQYIFLDLINGGWAQSFLTYFYRDGVFYMWDELLPSIGYTGYMFHFIYCIDEARANGFVRYDPMEIRWFLYDRDVYMLSAPVREIPDLRDFEPGIYAPGGAPASAGLDLE